MRNRFNDEDGIPDIFDDIDEQWPPLVAIRTAKLGSSAAFADLFDVANAITLYLGQDEEVRELCTFLLDLAVKTLLDEEETNGDS